MWNQTVTFYGVNINIENCWLLLFYYMKTKGYVLSEREPQYL